MHYQEFDSDADIYGYLRDHEDEHLCHGNIDNSRNENGYEYIPVGIALSGGIEPIARAVAEKNLLRPGDTTPSGKLIVRINDNHAS